MGKKSAEPRGADAMKEPTPKDLSAVIQDRAEAFRHKAHYARKEAAAWTARAEQLEADADDLIAALERVQCASA